MSRHVPTVPEHLLHHAVELVDAVLSDVTLIPEPGSSHEDRISRRERLDALVARGLLHEDSPSGEMS